MTKGRLCWLCLAIGTVWLTGCQKELDESQIRKICEVTRLTVTASGNLVEEYIFAYDPISLRTASITQRVPGASQSKIMLPVYSNDTIYLGGASFLIRDGAGRVVRLSEQNALGAGVNGDYYYTYAAGGVMRERIFDDGSSASEKTVFTFSNDSLVRYAQDFNGLAGAFTAGFTYQSSNPIGGFAQYQLLDIFPELTPYLTLVNLGVVPSYPLTAAKYAINIPGSPAVSFGAAYGGYGYTDPDGFLQSYTNTLTLPGSPAVTIAYGLEYTCYN